MKIRQKFFNREWTRNILKLISQGKKYSSEISKYCDRAQSVICRQLVVLEEEGFVHSHREKLKNKLIFDLTEKGKLLLSYFQESKLLKNKYQEILI